MLTNQVIFETIDSILKRSISDVDKAKAILSFMSSNGVEVWQIKNATGYTEDQINDFLALATPPQPSMQNVPDYAVYAVADFVDYPAVTTTQAIPGAGGFWERGPGSYEYVLTGTPLVYNVTFVDRVKSGMDEYQWTLASKILSIINLAAATNTNPAAQLKAINLQNNDFASKFIADIGLGGQMRMYTGDASFYGSGPSPDIQAKMQFNPGTARVLEQVRTEDTTFEDGTPVPVGPKRTTTSVYDIATSQRVVADAGATKPPLSPAEVRTGITTPVVKLPIVPSETPTPTPTPTPVTASNVLPLALAAIAFYFLG